MRFSIVRTILLKELRETLRDRRTLLLTLGLPVLLYPLSILAFTRIAESGEDAIAAGRSAVAVWGTRPAPVERVLAAADGLTLLPWAGVPDDVRDEILSGRLTRVEAGPNERLPLTGAYLELVWSELLGPTATPVARRIGRALQLPDRPVELSLTDVGNSLGVAPAKVLWSLKRLAYFELIAISSSPAAVVTSGLLTPVPRRLFSKLSPAGLLEHRDQLRAPAGRALSVVWPGGPAGQVMRRQCGRAL